MIHLLLDGLPPSSNNAYFNLPRGGRTLTKEGRSFLTRTKVELAQKYPQQMMFFKQNVPYMLMVRFHVAETENSGFAKGTAKSRYKKLDVGNRLKLLEDALKDAAGIDDSQNMIVILEKRKAVAEEMTEIWVWSLEEEPHPFNDFLQRL